MAPRSSDTDASSTGRPEFSLAETLDVIAPHAARALVPEAAWTAVRDAAGTIPAALADGIYLECRLAGPPAPVDLILRVDARGRAALGSLPEALRTHPVWERVRDLAARWAAASPAILGRVDHLWLEFDVEGGAAGAVPVPSLFVAPDPDAVRSLDTGDWMRLLDACASALLPGGLAPETREALGAVLAARPPGGGIPYLGFMLARPRPAVRVYYSGVEEADLASVLTRGGWRGDARLSEVLARLGPAEERPPVGMAHLDVDGGAVLGRVGVEYTFDRRAQVRGRVAEAPFLARIAEAGFCDDARLEALLAWPGWEARRLRHEIWESRIVRRVNCVKLVVDPARPPEAKGYLLTSHRPAVRFPSAR